MKKDLYIVFEKIHSLKLGGLIATYVSLVPIWQKYYNVKIISLFRSLNSDHLFDDCEIITLSNKQIDFNFPHLFQELKHFHILRFFKLFFDLCYYFLSIPFLRHKMKKVISKQDLVLVTCPVAAAFLPKNYPFLLEIHIYYEYFFGKNLLGNLQAKMMQKPALTLFRTKMDSEKAKDQMNAGYVYNFFDNTGILPSKKLVKNRICYVGRLSEQKNPLRLLRLARLLKEKYPDFVLDIYGTGEYYDEMKEKIQDYGLAKHVFLKGFTKDKTIYKNYSLLWMTSLFEGLSLVMIEAKANGIPIFTTPCGDGVYEVVHDGVDGFIFDNDEAYVQKTIEVLTNEALQKQLSKNSYQDFKRFSKEQAEKNWLQIFDKFTTDFLD